MKEASKRLRQLRSKRTSEAIDESIEALEQLQNTDIRNLFDDELKAKIYELSKRLTESIESDGFNSRVWLQGKITESTFRLFESAAPEMAEAIEFELDSPCPRWFVLDCLIRSFVNVWEMSHVRKEFIEQAKNTRIEILKLRRKV